MEGLLLIGWLALGERFVSERVWRLFSFTGLLSAGIKLAALQLEVFIHCQGEHIDLFALDSIIFKVVEYFRDFRSVLHDRQAVPA